MRTVFTPDMRAFLADFIPGHCDEEVAAEIRGRFGADIMPGQVRDYRKRNKVRNGLPHVRKKAGTALFPEEVREFIRANNRGRSAEQMRELLKAEFGRDYTPGQIKAVRARMRLDSGLTGRFERGNVPANKGRKGVHYAGCEKGWFKKGGRPHNAAPVGTEAVTPDGYIKVKVAEPDKWSFKHRLVWELHNGKVPPGTMVCFRNGDRADCRIENLMLETRTEHSVMNKRGLRSPDPDLTDAGLALTKVILRLGEIERADRQCEGDIADD